MNPIENNKRRWKIKKDYSAKEPLVILNLHFLIFQFTSWHDMINKRQSVQDSNTKKRRRHNSSDNSNTEMSIEESNTPITSVNKSKNASNLWFINRCCRNIRFFSRHFCIAIIWWIMSWAFHRVGILHTLMFVYHVMSACELKNENMELQKYHQGMRTFVLTGTNRRKNKE